MSLADTLDRIVAYTARVNPALHEHLQPGVDAAAFLIARNFPYYLPDEVQALYQWHNGTHLTDADPWEELFYYHAFLSIEDAYAEYLQLQAANAEIGEIVYEPNLFPLFTFMGEYYSVECCEEPTARGRIFFVFQGEVQVYDSLTSMFVAILDCYDQGGYELVDGEYKAHEAEVAAIKARWNHCRRLDNGTIFPYHP